MAREGLGIQEKVNDDPQQTVKNMSEEAGEIIHALQRFSNGFKGIRRQIEEMSDEQLVELYERAKEISNVSWLIRCIILGTAHDRAIKGDKTVVGLAETFGIGRRMAELDIQVYNTFVKPDKDFEPLMPAAFYQLAARQPDPESAISLAIERKTENPKFTSSEFSRLLRGEVPKEPMTPGVYLLVPSDVGIEVLTHEAGLDESGVTELFARARFLSIGGRNYVEIP
jgi:hypothetical protein